MHPNHGTPLWIIGHRLLSIPTTGDYAFADVVLTPGMPGPPPHHHEVADELYICLEGALQILRGDTWHTLRRGESLRVEKGTRHTFREVEGEPGRFVSIHDPGGPMDMLFLEHGIPVSEDDAFERSISETALERFAADAAAHDMVIATPEPA